jgi:competence protein ComEA
MNRLGFAVAALMMLFGSTATLADQVNINTADVAALEAGLDGVGPEKAAAIIKYREENGAFKSADDLANVQGIGPATVEKNRAKITLGDAAASAEPAPAATPAPAPAQ